LSLVPLRYRKRSTAKTKHCADPYTTNDWPTFESVPPAEIALPIIAQEMERTAVRMLI
jgi:hypothetical protein